MTDLNDGFVEKRSKMPGTFLRVDLCGSTYVYLKYLESWEVFVNANDEQLVRRAIRRYERFWLTLLHQHGDNNSEVHLQPPMDVHWIWHLHMLQPSTYYVYCKQRFGRILPHRFFHSENEIHASRIKTAAAWRKAFPNEPFEFDLAEQENNFKLPTATRLDHLIDLAKREKHFNHRIALAHFRDQRLHYSAESRYKQLLALKQSYDWEPRCLPSDVELVWRFHMLQPLDYIKDIKRFLNLTDGSASPFSVQSFLTTGINYLEHLPCSELMTFISVSNQFWRSVYPADDSLFFVDGSTPRSMELRSAPRAGQKVETILLPFRSEEYDDHVVEACDITFTSLVVEELWTKQKNFKVTVKLVGVNSFKQEPIFECKGAIGQVITQPDKKFRLQGAKEQNILGKCRFDPRENRGIELQVFACIGFGCFVKHRLLTTKLFDPLQNIAINAGSQGMASLSLGQSTLPGTKKLCVSSDNINNLNKRQQIVMPRITSTDPKVTLNYKVEISDKKPFQFVMDRNSGESTSLPEYLETLLSGIINWQEVLTDVEHGSTFMVARHSLKCRDLGLAFGVEIVRNDFNNLFAVSLFHNNQHLVAVAYSIDQHYLASTSQVLETCPLTFNPLKGDLAMMIRSHKGEEMIVIAKWVEGNNFDNMVHLMTYDIRSRQMHHTQIAEDEQHSFSNEAITVDLPSGRLTVSCSASKLPNNIVWAFCVGCLYISIQRPNTSLALKDTTSILSLPSGEGSMRSGSAQISFDGSNDTSSIGRRNKKKQFIQQYRQNKRHVRRRKMSASFTFLLACGFRVEMISSFAADNNATSKSSTLRLDQDCMVDATSFSYLTGDINKSHPDLRNNRLSSRSHNNNNNQSDKIINQNSKYFESNFNCESVETSIFERV